MSLLVLTLVLAQAPAPPRQARATAAEKAERAFFDQVSVSLSLDHSVYHVGEPVRLKISMRNGGSTLVRGYLDVLPSSEMTEIYYRRRNGTFRRFLVEMPDAEAVNVQFVSQPLDPGSEHTSEVTLAFDPQTGLPVLDQPGEYEFKVVYRGLRKLRGQPIESDVASATSSAPPASEEEALTRYMAGGLARLAQYDARTSIVDRATVSAAGEFLNHHRQSTYAAAVRQGLLQYLIDRIDQQRASAEDRRLYDEVMKTQD